MRRRRLLALCAALTLLALAGGASAASDPVKRPPSLLWKSYPLKQRATAVSLVHPLRPPALAEGTGSRSGGGLVISPYLLMLSLFGGAMLAVAGLLGKSLVKDVAGIATARRGRSAEPERASTEEAKPDMLVALRPASATAEADPDLDEVEGPESGSEPPVSQSTVEIDDEDEVEPEHSEQAATPLFRPLRIFLLMEPPLTEERESERESPPLRALPPPLPPLEDQLPEIPALHEEVQPLPLELTQEREQEPDQELEPAPESARFWREAAPKKQTELGVEICQIRLWRGYVRYQLYAASGGDEDGRVLAHSPYFRVKDPERPSAQARAALRNLLDQLEARDWAVTHEGSHWYSFRLERPL